MYRYTMCCVVLCSRRMSTTYRYTVRCVPYRQLCLNQLACLFRIAAMVSGRGLHSFTFQLNISAFYGIGDDCWVCLGIVWRVLRGIAGC